MKEEVIIIGAGPVGLASALALSKRGVAVKIIERDERPGTHSYALALHPAVSDMLDEWGVLDQLKKDSLAIQSLAYCDRKGPKMRLDLSTMTGQEKGLLVVGQDHLEKALLGPLEAAKVPVRWNSRLSGIQQQGDIVEIRVEKLIEGLSGYAMARIEWQVDKEVTDQCHYLIGADGHRSMVRRAIDIDFPMVAPTQSFAVFEFKTDFDHNNEARIVYSDEGTNVMWPLPNGYCRWGFEIDPAAAAQYSREKDRLFVQIGNQGFSTLESKVLRELLEKRAPWFNGSVEQFRWRVIVRFEKRLASSFGGGRVWLAGDAGHVTGPIGMQSMNIGMQEGRDLANIIADCIQHKKPVDSLLGYEDGRLSEWNALLGLSKRFVPSGDADPFLAKYADALFASIPASMNSLPAYAKALSMRLVSI